MKRQVHCVEWLDAEANADWMKFDDIKKMEAPTCLTFGVVVERNKREWKVAATVSEDDGNNTMTIPAGMIVRSKAIATVEIPYRVCAKKDGEPTPLSRTPRTKKAPRRTTSLPPETT